MALSDRLRVSGVLDHDVFTPFGDTAAGVVASYFQGVT